MTLLQRSGLILFVALGLAIFAACGGGSDDGNGDNFVPTLDPEEFPPETEVTPMQFSSSAFADRERIPVQYSCEGEGISPPISISDVPADTVSLVLIVEDVDSEAIPLFTHWVVYNIDPSVTEFAEGTVPEGALEGANNAGSNGWFGPCPPSGAHRYAFQLFALDRMIDLPAGATKNEVAGQMLNHVILNAGFVGIYGEGEPGETPAAEPTEAAN